MNHLHKLFRVTRPTKKDTQIQRPKKPRNLFLNNLKHLKQNTMTIKRLIKLNFPDSGFQTAQTTSPYLPTTRNFHRRTFISKPVNTKSTCNIRREWLSVSTFAKNSLWKMNCVALKVGHVRKRKMFRNLINITIFTFELPWN